MAVLSSTFTVAYDSLLSGWQDFLAHDDNGRPIILIGDSQGSAILIHLIATQIDHDPATKWGWPSGTSFATWPARKPPGPRHITDAGPAVLDPALRFSYESASSSVRVLPGILDQP